MSGHRTLHPHGIEEILSDGDEEESQDEEESDEDVDSNDDQEQEPWISWFCSFRGHEFFCEIDEDYIRDNFNLTGLSSLVRWCTLLRINYLIRKFCSTQVPHYELALDLILDDDADFGESASYFKRQRCCQ